MSDIEKEIEKYLSEIGNNLVCSGKSKKEIISEIEGSIYDYAERKGIRDVSEVYNHFGTPEEMARTYLSQVEPKKIKRAVNVRKVVIIGVIIALLMLVCWILLSLMDGHKSNIGYVEYYSVKTNTDAVEYSPIETNIIIIED